MFYNIPQWILIISIFQESIDYENNSSDDFFIDDTPLDFQDPGDADASSLLEHQKNLMKIANNLNKIQFLDFTKTSPASFKHFLKNL